MPYRYLDDIATADVAFSASGINLEELFISCGQALMNVMVEDLSTIKPQQYLRMQLENNQLDMLLFQYLQDFIFHKDAGRLLLLPQKVEINRKNSDSEDIFCLRARAAGEKIDISRHEMLVDVKAVTLHRFELMRKNDQWQVIVVLDV